MPVSGETTTSKLTKASRTFLTRAAASTFVLIAINLVCVDAIVKIVKPLRYFNTTAFTPLDQNPVVSKLPNFMSSLHNPDVVLISSSLMVVPAVRVDDEMEGRRARYDIWYRRNHLNEYAEARYLQKLMSKQFGRELSLANLGIIASMMSDHCLIFDKMVKSGKHPRLVVCALAPRDFMDNVHPVPERTLVHLVLADFTSLGDVFEQNPSFERVAECAVGIGWHFFKVRADYRSFLSAWAADLTGHAATLHGAIDKAKTALEENQPDGVKQKPETAHTDAGLGVGQIATPIYAVPSNRLQDLPTYRQVYLPPNKPLFERQVKYLNRLAELAAKADISLVLVNMPLTAENKEVLPPGWHDRYMEAVSTVAQKHNLEFIDLDVPGKYSLPDFEDSCHLNASGGKKMYAALVEALSRTDVATTSLTGSSVAARQADSTH